MRVFNFSAGPAVLPLEVLEQARAELIDWQGSGMSVMEMSHRSKAFIAVRRTRPRRTCATLLAIPANYKVLFLQGGATGMFAAIPMNLAAPDSTRRLRQHRRLVEEGASARPSATARSTSPPTRPRRNYTERARAVAAGKLDAGRGLRALHAQRDHRRRGVRLRARSRRRAAGRRHVLDDPVAADRCQPLRPDLRRRAEEHRPVGHLRGHRARGPARQGARRHARRLGLQGDGRRRIRC